MSSNFRSTDGVAITTFIRVVALEKWPSIITTRGDERHSTSVDLDQLNAFTLNTTG
jgi:hypothetical protein